MSFSAGIAFRDTDVRELKLGAPKYKCETPIIQPPAGSRGRAPGQGSEGRSPSETETLLAFERSLKTANLPTLKN